MLTIRRLDSGYYHIRGQGPCNWSQPRGLTEEEIRACAFPQASETFLRAAIALAASGTEQEVGDGE